jgi:hypothetical protein
LFVTYIVVKLALQAVVQECNRMAYDAETQAKATFLKSRIAELEMEFSRGVIDEETYKARAAGILSELGTSSEAGAQPGGA